MPSRFVGGQDVLEAGALQATSGESGSGGDRGVNPEAIDTLAALVEDGSALRATAGVLHGVSRGISF
ncbi:hypothetical protein [Cryobacterium psychrophilum]|uniref:hypothetical protein n=1 Tax=Cryobacterium psychrophilum TaxID=41988 RepID=UPI001417069F|nr:hypothetical protein [Cryobacterium psychrophilum]